MTVPVGKRSVPRTWELSSRLYLPSTGEPVRTVDQMSGTLLDSFERIKEDMSWKAGDSPPAFGSIRALSNANYIKRAIDVHFPENGAGIGEGGTKTSYSTSRAQVVCGECDERVTSETNAIDACRSVVSRLGLRCCS